MLNRLSNSLMGEKRPGFRANGGERHQDHRLVSELGCFKRTQDAGQVGFEMFAPRAGYDLGGNIDSNFQHAFWLECRARSAV